MPLPPADRRALRRARLDLLQAQQDREDAVVAAHHAGGTFAEIAKLAGLSVLEVRVLLERRQVAPRLTPKETAARAGT